MISELTRPFCNGEFFEWPGLGVCLCVCVSQSLPVPVSVSVFLSVSVRVIVCADPAHVGVRARAPGSSFTLEPPHYSKGSGSLHGTRTKEDTRALRGQAA